MGKERIGIEFMLQKAYREWRVERITPVSVLGLTAPESPKVAGGGFMALGTRIDGPSAGAMVAARQQAAMRVPQDMVDLHDMVLSLPDVFAWFGSGELQLWTEADAREAGGGIARADGHNAWTLTLPGEPARRVRQIVTSMVVIEHARLATRPNWHPEGMKIRPYRKNSHGRAEVWEDEGRKFCPIVIEPLASQVWEARGQYVVWWDALRLLAGQGFDAYTPDLPGCDRRPWGAAARVIHNDCAMGKAAPRLSR